jgi:hypothetical protein
VENAPLDFRLQYRVEVSFPASHRYLTEWFYVKSLTIGTARKPVSVRDPTQYEVLDWRHFPAARGTISEYRDVRLGLHARSLDLTVQGLNVSMQSFDQFQKEMEQNMMDLEITNNLVQPLRCKSYYHTRLMLLLPNHTCRGVQCRTHIRGLPAFSTARLSVAGSLPRCHSSSRLDGCSCDIRPLVASAGSIGCNFRQEMGTSPHLHGPNAPRPIFRTQRTIP